jgi:hypothetical protein
LPLRSYLYASRPHLISIGRNPVLKIPFSSSCMYWVYDSGRRRFVSANSIPPPQPDCLTVKVATTPSSSLLPTPKLSCQKRTYQNTPYATPYTSKSPNTLPNSSPTASPLLRQHIPIHPSISPFSIRPATPQINSPFMTQMK